MKNILIPGLAAGFGMLIVSFGFGFLINGSYTTLNLEYQNPNLFRPWSDPLMQLFYLGPFILGLGLAFIWNKIKASISGKSVWIKGLKFGLGYFLVGTIPGMFISYSSFPISLLMIMSWTVSGLLEAITAGIILARINRSG